MPILCPAGPSWLRTRWGRQASSDGHRRRGRLREAQRLVDTGQRVRLTGWAMTCGRFRGRIASSTPLMALDRTAAAEARTSGTGRFRTAFGVRKGAPMDSQNNDQFLRALGTAVVSTWGKLPADVQHVLFEEAIAAGHHNEQDESLREQLAVFLHDRHPRTQDV